MRFTLLLAAAVLGMMLSPESAHGEEPTPMNTSRQDIAVDQALHERLGGEPICRVGVVLEEDNKSRLEALLTPGQYSLKTSGGVIPLVLSEPLLLVFEVHDERITATRPHDNLRFAPPSAMIRLECSSPPERLAPRMGVLLKGCVTGRGFHWQKEVDFYFPYHLEFHQRNGRLIVVNEIPMEPYLACVVTSEMSKDCPPEFIKAQATAARSWMQVFLKNKHRGEPYTICNDDDCQRYQGTTWLEQSVADAVRECRGMFLVNPDGSVCPAYYSKSCGGIMERGTNVFGAGAEALSEACDAPAGSLTERFNPVTEDTIREWVTGEWVKHSDSYCSPNVVPEDTLKRYIGAVDESGRYYRWHVRYERRELEQMLRTKAQIADLAEFLDFEPGPRGNSGRLMALTIVYRDDAGSTRTHEIRREYNIRKALHEKFLFSGAFVWDFERDAHGRIAAVTLRGAGWGHGAGLCQIGALGMALKGARYEDILKHYYSGAQLKRAY
ncbi:MAG: hypothetical protein Kow0059_01890 [Candidatus Sumerlaeia bacterium]